MKWIVLLFSWLIVTAQGFAQENTDTTQHMTFKGVPIDGQLDEFVAQMKESGFVLEDTDEGVALLEGDFAAYKNCKIMVTTLREKDLVSRVGVLFPQKETWAGLSSSYFNLKELLTVKYGEPSKVIEEFNTTFEPDDNDDRMSAVKAHDCKYQTIYKTTKGKIHLLIKYDDSYSSFVLLKYYDKINSKKIRQKALDDL